MENKLIRAPLLSLAKYLYYEITVVIKNTNTWLKLEIDDSMYPHQY